jgi:pyruvate-ferredoxin/flavodoxin oxidoreductase
MGAKMAQAVQAFQEAEAYPGPSLIIAYSHCIAHGYDMAFGAEQQKLAVESGVWPLYRFDPRRFGRGEAPLKLDYGAPKVPVADYIRGEGRFRVVEKTDPERFGRLLDMSQRDAHQRYVVYRQLAGVTVPRTDAEAEPPAAAPSTAEEVPATTRRMP